MEKKVAILLLLLLSLAGAQSTSRATQKHRGAWSGHAWSLFNTWGALDDNPGRSAEFVSPDAKKTIRVHGETVSVLIDGKSLPTKIGEMTNAELMWSPDSSSFVITSTTGGELGRWNVHLFVLDHASVRDVGEISKLAAADYVTQVKKRARPKDQPSVFWSSAQYCDVNVVASEWIGSQTVALAALVPNTSRCRRMSDWDGYIVKVRTGEIIERVPAAQMKKRFGQENVPR